MVAAHFVEERLVGGEDALAQGVVRRLFAQHLRCELAQARKHVVRQAAHLHAVFFHQRAHRRRVARGELVEHVLVDGLACGLQHRLQVRRQRRPRLGVDDGLQRGARFVPAGVVVELGDFLQAEREIVVGAHPLGGIHHAGLQGGEDLAARQGHGGAAGAPEHLAAEAGNAHLEALQVRQRVDLLVEPARHLHAGIAGRQGHQAKRRVQLPPQFQAAAVTQPAVHLLRGHAERHGGEEGGHRHLAAPVVGGPVAHLRVALGDRVEHLQGRHQFAGGVHLDLEPPSRHGGHQLRQLLRRRPQSGQVLRPSGDELPLHARPARRRSALGGFPLLGGTRRQQRGDQDRPPNLPFQRRVQSHVERHLWIASAHSTSRWLGCPVVR